MIKLYRSLGPEKFPLNEQTFYPSHAQMVSVSHDYSFKTKTKKAIHEKAKFGSFFIKSLLQKYKTQK